MPPYIVLAARSRAIVLGTPTASTGTQHVAKARYLAASAPCLCKPALNVPAAILCLAALRPVPTRAAATPPSPPPPSTSAAVPASLPPRAADTVSFDPASAELCSAGPDNTRTVISADALAGQADTLGGGAGRHAGILKLGARSQGGRRTPCAADCHRHAAPCGSSRNTLPSAPAMAAVARQDPAQRSEHGSLKGFHVGEVARLRARAHTSAHTLERRARTHTRYAADSPRRRARGHALTSLRARRPPSARLRATFFLVGGT
jgi:hypothetical protein